MILAGKVVAVTGAGRGIGREVALLCAREGAAVVVNDPGVGRDGEGGDPAPAEQVADEIRAVGGKAQANLASVVDPVAAQTIVDDALASFGRIDAVVNCAGILRDAIWHKMSHADWHAVIDVHLHGSFNVSKAATPAFREQQSGSFIHFTSGAGLIGNIGQANYSAAKLGIVGLSQSIALDMARYGMRSNCIAPVAWTRMIAGMSDLVGGEEPPASGMADMGAEKVAPLAAYLASDQAVGVTNQIFGVHGDEIVLFSKPRPIHSMVKAEGWTAQAIADELIPALREDFARPDEVAAELFKDKLA
jgi:NAD(P)-dependent dehydrogenase (short-subunit alcohol dehydrogenase family)